MAGGQSPARVVLIEDDADIRRALELLLTEHGYQTFSRQDGRSGLQAVLEEQPDLVVLDVGLPELDGWQVLQRVRRHSDVPVIMLTAEGGPSDVVRGLRSGADDYLTKPYRANELLARIEALLRRHRESSGEPVVAAADLVRLARERRGRVIVADDDPDLRRLLELVLTQRGGYSVTALASAEEALLALGDASVCDAVVSDIHMSGRNGLELAAAVQAARPGLPTVLVTGDARMSTAVEAMRAGAADFVAKPIRPAALVEAVQRAISRFQDRRERVLAIGAHPDDVEIGAGGALLVHAAQADEVTVLTMSAGATGGDPARRQEESVRAAALLDARLYLGELPDTAIPEGRPTIDVVEEVVAAVRPTIVYVHSSHDHHQDHRAVHSAAMIATRRVGRVYGYRSPSATVDFRPTRFVDVGSVMSRKIALLAAFASQIGQRDYLAEDLLIAQARVHGTATGTTYAEPLEVLRESTPASAAFDVAPQMKDGDMKDGTRALT
jgi:DNA-binding response OmpR family regulator